MPAAFEQSSHLGQINDSANKRRPGRGNLRRQPMLKRLFQKKI